MQNYSCIDKRIYVYSQSNQGVAKARENGVIKAKGNYITFLDVDDSIEPNSLLSAINTLKFKNGDILVSSFNIITNGKCRNINNICFKEISRNEYFKLLLSGICGWELCGKIYKKSVFERQISTPNHLRIGEDAAVYVQLVYNSSVIIGFDIPFYNYIINNQSASHIKSKKYAEETIEAAFYIEDLLLKYKLPEDIYQYIGSMYLLFFSNSISKGYLGNDHKYVKYIKSNHFNYSSFKKIKLIKVLYILFVYFTNGNILKLIKRI